MGTTNSKLDTVRAAVSPEFCYKSNDGTRPLGCRRTPLGDYRAARKFSDAQALLTEPCDDEDCQWPCRPQKDGACRHLPEAPLVELDLICMRLLLFGARDGSGHMRFPVEDRRRFRQILSQTTDQNHVSHMWSTLQLFLKDHGNVHVACFPKHLDASMSDEGRAKTWILLRCGYPSFQPSSSSSVLPKTSTAWMDTLAQHPRILTLKNKILDSRSTIGNALQTMTYFVIYLLIQYIPVVGPGARTALAQLWDMGSASLSVKAMVRQKMNTLLASSNCDLSRSDSADECREVRRLLITLGVSANDIAAGNYATVKYDTIQDATKFLQAAVLATVSVQPNLKELRTLIPHGVTTAGVLTSWNIVPSVLATVGLSGFAATVAPAICYMLLSKYVWPHVYHQLACAVAGTCNATDATKTSTPLTSGGNNLFLIGKHTSPSPILNADAWRAYLCPSSS